MPYDVSHPCSFPGCPKLVSRGSSRCELHRNRDRIYPDHQKLYNTRKWKRLRRLHLRAHPWCKICNTDENLEVDHIEDHKGNPDLFFDAFNLQTLCKVHHSQKTGKTGLTRKMGLTK